MKKRSVCAHRSDWCKSGRCISGIEEELPLKDECRLSSVGAKVAMSMVLYATSDDTVWPGSEETGDTTIGEDDGGITDEMLAFGSMRM